MLGVSEGRSGEAAGEEGCCYQGIGRRGLCNDQTVLYLDLCEVYME